MSTAHYLLQANIYLIVFYMVYKFLLEKETYFVLNRIYLLSSALLSLCIPFLKLEWFTTQPAAQTLYVGVDQLNTLMLGVIVPSEDTDLYSPGRLIAFIYLAGAMFFTGKLIWQLIHVARAIKNSRPGSAFSFFRYKRIDGNLPHPETIHKHEEAHIRQLHSVDILFFEFLNIFFWFNPVIYACKRSIKNVHEYLADEAAAQFQGDKRTYALLLLSSTFNVPTNILTNSFFTKSLIKNRIIMLHKERSRKMAVLKYGMFVPILALTLIMSSATIRENEKLQQITSEIPLDHPSDIVRNVITQTIHQPKDTQSIRNGDATSNDETHAPTKETRTFANTAWKDFYQHLAKFVRYPLAAQQSDLQGTSMIKFTVSNGALDNIGVVSKLGGDCDAEAMKVIASYPGFKNSKDGNYTIKLKFNLDNSKAPKKNENLSALKGYTALSDVVIVAYSRSNDKPKDDVHSFVAITKQPSFPGGMRAFYEYLNKNIKYPAEAVKNKIHGKVYLSFIVEKDGSISHVNVDRQLGSGTDEEAVRVLNESPKWIPGEKDGNPVRVKYNIPISFNLNKNGILDTLSKPALKGLGTLQPLILLDGKPVATEEMKKISPNDIQSVEVIKDQEKLKAYGEKGKNGVIIMTSKKPVKD